MDGNSERLLTPGEVAALFRVDPKTVTRWAASGRISSIRTPGGHRRFRESEVRALLGRLSLIEMAPQVLARALEPFPTAVRTLDALHLAAMEFLRTSGQTVELACYDERLLAAARAMRFGVVVL